MAKALTPPSPSSSAFSARWWPAQSSSKSGSAYRTRRNLRKALEYEYGWKEVHPAAAAQGLVFGVVKAGIQRGGAKGFERLTGVWPGD